MKESDFYYILLYLGVGGFIVFLVWWMISGIFSNEVRRIKGSSSEPSGVLPTTPEAIPSSRQFIYWAFGSIAACIFIAWAMSAIESAGGSPTDGFRHWLRISAIFISPFSIVWLLIVIGLGVYRSGKSKGSRTIIASPGTFQEQISPESEGMIRKMSNSESSVNSVQPAPPGSPTGDFLVMIALLIIGYGAYCYTRERVSTEGDGLGLSFTMFCYPIGLLILGVALMLVQYTGSTLKFIGWVFGIISVIYFFVAYLSPWSVPIERTSGETVFYWTEFINPLLAFICYGLGRKLGNK